MTEAVHTTCMCAVQSCTRYTKGPKYICCYEHWMMVPLVLQKTIWRLWNNGAPLGGYTEACASAVDQANDQIRRQRSLRRG